MAKKRRQRRKERQQKAEGQSPQPQASQPAKQEPTKQAAQSASKPSEREILRARLRRRENLRKNIPMYIGAAVVLGLLAFFGWQSFGPRAGEAVEILESEHIEPGEEHEPYSNPPSSGMHYASSQPSGFYNEFIEPEYLVHNLEHGYAVIWYNCDHLEDEDACTDLKVQLRRYVTEDGGKLVGAPYEPLDVPLAISTWGRIMKLDGFDEEQLDYFIRTNRGKDAPEPLAQ